MSPYNPIQLERIYEQIISQIEQQIISGALKVGDKLPSERELAEQFQVSRTAVREAVKALRARGLLEIRHGRGIFITNEVFRSATESLSLMMKISTAQLGMYTELFELRKIIEPPMAALAAARASQEDLIAMESAVATMDASLDNMDAYIAADNMFHQAIAHATQNRLLASLLDPIMEQLTEQRMRNFMAGVQSPERAQNHHKKIIAAIKSHDPAGAQKSMKSHLEQVILDIEITDREEIPNYYDQ